ncbi:MAG TPA: hypothetical protein VFV64_05625 [Permianibacter sp.]|nr:hypothetical protein [Permianibacter sp.]
MDTQVVAKSALDVILWSGIILIFLLLLLIRASSLPSASKRNIRLALASLSIVCFVFAFPVREVIASMWRTTSLCKLSKTHFEGAIPPQSGIFFSGPYASDSVLTKSKGLVLYVENIDSSSISYLPELYEEESERSECLLVDTICEKHPLMKRYGIKYRSTRLVDGYYRTTKQEQILSTYEVNLTTARFPRKSRTQSFSTTGIDIRISERGTDKLISHHRTYQSELGIGCENRLASDVDGEIAEFISRSIAKVE